NLNKSDLQAILHRYGQAGVNALASATPVETGLSSESWDYEVYKDGKHVGITWTNHDVTITGVPVVILLQYGHGTGTGGYVQGHDFINPAIRPIFNKISEDLWKAVKDA